MENMTVEEVRTRLMATSEEFRRLAEKHANYDRRIEELASRRFPSQEEQTEEARLKKMKLHLKDQMTHMVQEYAHHPA